MDCPKCGAANFETSSNCRICKTPLLATAEQETQAMEPLDAAAVAAASGAGAAAQAASSTAPAAAASASEPTAAAPTAAGSAQPAASARQEGILGAAWKDITGTPGWIRKVLLLCLVGCVPILSLAVEGYALRWARELSFGKRDHLPKEIFRRKTILTGFRATLIDIIWVIVFAGLAALVVTCLFGLVGAINMSAGIVVAALAALVILVASLMLVYPLLKVAVTRMGVVDYLEGGFNLPKVIRGFRRSSGDAIGAVIIPTIIVFLLQLLPLLLLSLFAGSITPSVPYSAVSDPSLMGAASLGAASGVPELTSPQQSFSLIFGVSAITTVIAAVVYLFFAMVSSFATLVLYRALGHWAALTTPEWADEALEQDPELVAAASAGTV